MPVPPSAPPAGRPDRERKQATILLIEDHADSAVVFVRLLVAYLLDKTGKVVARYTGRIPPEAWDKIADLL